MYITVGFSLEGTVYLYMEFIGVVILDLPHLLTERLCVCVSTCFLIAHG